MSLRNQVRFLKTSKLESRYSIFLFRKPLEDFQAVFLF